MKKIACLFYGILLLLSLTAQTSRLDTLKNLLQKQQTDSGRIRILLEMGGQLSSFFSATDSSMSYLKQALYLSQKTRDTVNEISCRNNLSSKYRYFNDYSSALEISFPALKLARQLNDTTQIFWSLREVLFTYVAMEDYKKAMEYIASIKSLLSSGYFKDPATLERYKMIGYINVLGRVYEGAGLYDSALAYRRMAYKISQSLKDPQGVAIALINLGSIYSKLNKIDSAFFIYRETIRYALESGRQDVWARAAISIGSLFQQKKNTDSAFMYLRTALDKSRRIRYSEGIMVADSVLSELYASVNRFDSAYVHLKNYMIVKDSIFSSEKAMQAQNITFTETLRQQRIDQEKKEARQAYANKLKFYVLSAGLMFLSVLAIVLYRNNKQKNKANQQIGRAYKDLKATQSQLIQSEKMASLGELTAGIAHEIQNPLNFVNNFSEVNNELIEELKSKNEKLKIEDNEVNELLSDIYQNNEKISIHGKRADSIVKGMLQHSRTSSGQKELTDINSLADEYLRLAYHGLRAKDKSFNAKFETDFDSNVGKINIIPQDIGRVILNLINNAFYAVNEKAKESANGYEPTLTLQTKKLNDKVEIKIKDNGNGIPKNIVDKIFQPFFTTKPTGQGTGLGLSLAYDIVKAHGGEIKVVTKDGEGSEFIIQLPINKT